MGALGVFLIKIGNINVHMYFHFVIESKLVLLNKSSQTESFSVLHHGQMQPEAERE